MQNASSDPIPTEERAGTDEQIPYPALPGSGPGADDVPQPERTPDPDAAQPPSVVGVDVLARWLGLEPACPAPPSPDVPAFASGPAPERLVLLDVRHQSGVAGGSGHGGYLHGHLPGAVYVSLDAQLARHAGPHEGRHPLPDPVQFGEAVRMWGVGDGDTVVVYDDAAGLAAARAWWLLRHAGIGGSLLLDGGLGAWRAAGLPLQAGEVIPVPGTARTSWGRMPVVDGVGAEALAAGGLLIDARAPERYRGESEPLDPVPGHIPGAVNLPARDCLDEDGRLLHPEVLAARFEAAGVDETVPTAVYCGSGVTAAHEVLALAVAGVHGVALYPGSWSAWIQDPDNPVAAGAEPGGR